MLESIWNQETHHYTQKDLADARNVLIGLLPSIEKIYVKSKLGSPQRTLLERRIKSLNFLFKQLIIFLINNFSKHITYDYFYIGILMKKLHIEYYKGGREVTTIISPKLEKLKNQLKNGNEKALYTFWMKSSQIIHH